MIKDIFIDHNIAKNFSNPADINYKKLIKWLMCYDYNDKKNNAYLVVSNKLLREYNSTPGFCYSASNITAIVHKCTCEGRLNKIENITIKKFRTKHFKNHVTRNFLSNRKDWDHISIVMLSDRKFALTIDQNLCHDINNFPGYSAIAVHRPQDLSYE